MRRTRWRLWHVVALLLAGAAVVVLHLGVDWLTGDPPNYSQIDTGLWLGGHVPEPPPGTQAVLNLCELDDPYRVDSHKWAAIRDGEPAPSLDWLEQQVAFIESERKAGHVVFVHCRQGVSRSALVMAAYLMRREGWSRDRTLEYLRTRRPEVRPNPAFMELLADWQRWLEDRTQNSPIKRSLP